MGDLSIGKIFMAIALVAAMFYGYQYAMSQAIHTVIASQPPPAKLAPAPSFDFSGCDLGINSTLYGRDRSGPSLPPCRFDPPAPPKAEPIATMSKEDAKKASIWFMLAGVGFPLMLMGAALAGFMVIRAIAGTDREEEY